MDEPPIIRETLSVDRLMKKLDAFQTDLGYHFKDLRLLVTSMTHRSFLNEDTTRAGHPYKPTESNERLEFLGDAILAHICASYLYQNYPQLSEGDLSMHRSQIVDAKRCGEYAASLKLHELILVGRGCLTLGARARENMLADLFEALLGAIYLDGGFDTARQFFLQHFEGTLRVSVASPRVNWKAALQDFCQKRYQAPPTYRVVERLGPQHNQHFRVAVEIDSTPLYVGEGSSIRTAQMEAAKQVLIAIKTLERASVEADRSVTPGATASTRQNTSPRFTPDDILNEIRSHEDISPEEYPKEYPEEYPEEYPDGCREHGDHLQNRGDRSLKEATQKERSAGEGDV